MLAKSLAEGRSNFLSATLFLFLLLVPAIGFCADTFPFDREFLLDAARMGRVKRLPMLVVGENGNAGIRLWCKDVRANVQVDGNKIHVDAGPLPDSLPSMMSDGQCSPERMQADIDMLTAISQVTDWRMQGDVLVLNGQRALRFRPSDH